MSIITLKAGGYEAEFWPQMGGACISLKKDGQDILRHYESTDAIKAAPAVYGLPFLFPPNRLDEGTFTFEGRSIRLPFNGVQRNVSCHGPLFQLPWKLEEVIDEEDAAGIRMTFTNRPGDDLYEKNWPFAFTLKQEYRLDAEGLHQKAIITNDDSVTMPLGLGWHSSFAAAAGDRIRISIGERVQVDDRMLPTGVCTPLTEEEARFRTEGQDPLYRDQDDHFTVKPLEIDGEAFHGVIINHPAEKTEVVYRVDDFYKHWMVYNGGCEGSFICIEPQNWRINAPNLSIDPSESGMSEVAAKDTLTVCADLSLRRY